MNTVIKKEILQATEPLKIVRLQIPAGGSVPEHHANVDVVVIVVRGAGAFTVAGDVRPIAQGDVVVMPPRGRHSIEAESDLELVVVHARLQPGAEAAGCGA